MPYAPIASGFELDLWSVVAMATSHILRVQPMEGKGTMRGENDRSSYEPPELRVLGTLHELTLGFCLFDKSAR